MWQSQYEITTDVAPVALYRAIADINNWSKWDSGLEYTHLEGPAKPGAPFVLKPRSGPKVKMTIDELRPHVLVDTAHLLGAKMRTTHEYTASGARTTIHFRVEVWGPLGFFWRKAVGEGQIKGAPAQLAAFVAYARRAGA